MNQRSRVDWIPVRSLLQRHRRTLFSLAAPAMLLIGAYVAAGHQVPVEPTAADVEATRQLLAEFGYKPVKPRTSTGIHWQV